MLILFPTGTDAPLYHPPFATGGLIALNIAVFVCQILFPGVNETLVLEHGSFNPIQWVTSAVMHGGIFHLLGNMIIFAIFSWIIEGKVGWWRTLLIYFGIAILSNGFEQLLFLFIPSSSGGSLGASGVVFGFFAIALLWAPENQLTLSYFGWFIFYPVVGTFEVSVSIFCFFMMAIEAAIVWFSFFEMSSSMLHIMGAIPGFLIGFLMLKFRRVNCDGYDMLSIWKGKHGQPTLTVAEEKEIQVEQERAKRRVREATMTGQQQVKKYLDAGQLEFAIRRLQVLKKANPRFVLPENLQLQMIRACDASRDHRQHIVLMIDAYFRHYQRNQVPLTLMLARFYVMDKESPRKAMGILKRIPQEKLSAREAKLFKALVAKSRELIRSGVLEMEE